MAKPNVPWESHGYRSPPPNQSVVWAILHPDVAFNPSNDQLRFLCLGSVQAGLLLVGLFRMWWNKKLPPLDPVREENALLLGILAGLGLGAIYWLADQAILHFWGPVPALSRSWLNIPSAGWNVPLDGMPDFWQSVEPHVAAWAMMGGVILLFPLAQVAFFCGGLGSLWFSADWRGNGVLVLGVIAAVLTFDWNFLPVSLLICLSVGWLYLRTQSLVVPLVALTILAAVILGMAFGAIPGLNHPTNEIVGKWQTILVPDPANVAHLEAAPLQFQRGGGLQQWTPRTNSVPSNVHYRPLIYQWTARDRIRLRWLRDTVDPATATIRVENHDVDYHVSFEYGLLKLTRLDNGLVFRYRRAQP